MTEDAPATRRKELRYRLADLLRKSHFETALSEALVAYSKGEILRDDFRFVVQIVQAAESAERATLPPPEIAKIRDLLAVSEKQLVG